MNQLEKQKRSRQQTKNNHGKIKNDLNASATAFVPAATHHNSLVKQVLVKTACESNANAMAVENQSPNIPQETAADTAKRDRSQLTKTEAELSKHRYT